MRAVIFTSGVPTLADFRAGAVNALAINTATGLAYYAHPLTGVVTPVTVGGSSSAGMAFTFSNVAPVSPTAGDIWIDSTSGIRYQYANDGTSSQWVEF